MAHYRAGWWGEKAALSGAPENVAVFVQSLGVGGDFDLGQG